MKIVRVGRVGSKIREVALPNNSYVQDALIAASIIKEPTEDIWLQHQIVTNTAGIVNGDTIILEKRAISQAIINFIDKLLSYGLIDDFEYMNEEEDILYDICYEDNKEMIDDLMAR